MTELIPDRPAAPGLAGTGTGAALVETLESTEPRAGEEYGLDDVRLSPTRLAIRRFLHHRLAMASLMVLVILTLMCAAAPLLASHGYAEVRGVKFRLQSPGHTRLFGTDTLGRDMFARVLYGPAHRYGSSWPAAPARFHPQWTSPRTGSCRRR